MPLPLPLSYPPMEAETAAALPEGRLWRYEPKWDGFRCLAFRDGAEVELRSKAGRPLGRYFPDVAGNLLGVDAARFVLDGELVIDVGGGRLSFDALQLRLHPAATRVERLVREHRARYVVFDLLVDADGEPLVAAPLDRRRTALERFAAAHLTAGADFQLSPHTADTAQARRWLEEPGGSLDGVIAKRSDLPYRSGERDGMVKVKRIRSADCVIGGFRYASAGRTVGSLLLGLYGDDGLLHHVGFTSAIPVRERGALTRRLEELSGPPGFTGRAPGGPSRWSREGRSTEWEPVRPELVVEVAYDHVSGGRFRHGTRLVRFRPDKAPAQCMMQQIER